MSSTAYSLHNEGSVTQHSSSPRAKIVEADAYRTEDWEYVDNVDSLYRWESEDRYSLEIYEDEDDGFVVDYVNEAEICSALMWDWSFEEPEEAFHYAQAFTQFFDESEYSEP